MRVGRPTSTKLLLHGIKFGCGSMASANAASAAAASSRSCTRSNVQHRNHLEQGAKITHSEGVGRGDVVNVEEGNDK